jgi:hypothetical protein
MLGIRWQMGSGASDAWLQSRRGQRGGDQVKKLSLKAKLWINCGSLLLILLVVGGIALKTDGRQS